MGRTNEAATAYRQNILIPYQKRAAEGFKSAAELIVSDKGGLTYRPIVGLHENVAELDFVSMYPVIMSKFNISPETVNCPCCHNQAVPEIGYSICTRRQGLIPQTLAPLVTKHIRYKMTAKQLPDGAQRELYQHRAKALKWILVTCFGYTGYKNARFGKIEAHEAINAYARAALIQTKEIVEAQGFEVLHALVDCVWIQKENVCDGEYADLIAEITQQTGLPIALEGVYNWIAFLPSHEHTQIGVPNRYYGVFRNGEVKTRGIELRRGDTAPFIKKFQQQAIELLAVAKNRQEFHAQVPAVLQLVGQYLEQLQARQVDYRDLVLTYRLTRDPKAYQHNTLNAIVVRELMQRGVQLMPGQAVRYVITASQSKRPNERARAFEFFDPTLGYDVGKYGDLLLRAAETILQPVPLTQSQINRALRSVPVPYAVPLDAVFLYL